MNNSTRLAGPAWDTPYQGRDRGLSLHIRLEWGLVTEVINAGSSHRGLRGKLRKSSSTQAVKNRLFSQHIALLRSLQGRSSQPLSLQQVGWSLAADSNFKPLPGDNVIVPLSLRSLAGRGCLSGSAWPLSTPHCSYRTQAKTQKLGNFPQDFRCLWGRKGPRLTHQSVGTTITSPTDAQTHPEHQNSIDMPPYLLHTALALQKSEPPSVSSI